MPKRPKLRPNYPEPGAWVSDVSPGMPEIEAPEPLSKEGKLSSGTIRVDYVAYEGLGFCIYTLIPPDRIADPKLRRLWIEARRAMQDVVEHLSRAGGPTGIRRDFPTHSFDNQTKVRPKKREVVEEEPAETDDQDFSIDSLGEEA